MTAITVHDLMGIMGFPVTEAQAEAVTRLAAEREDGGTLIPVEEIRKAIENLETNDSDVDGIVKAVCDLIVSYGPVNPPPVGSVWNGAYFEGPGGVDTHVGRRDEVTA